jgi:hypothetical protein
MQPDQDATLPLGAGCNLTWGGTGSTGLLLRTLHCMHMACDMQHCREAMADAEHVWTNSTRLHGTGFCSSSVTEQTLYTRFPSAVH